MSRGGDDPSNLLDGLDAAELAAVAARAAQMPPIGNGDLDAWAVAEELDRMGSEPDAATAARPVNHKIEHRSAFSKMAQQLDSRRVLVPAPVALGAKHVSNPE